MCFSAAVSFTIAGVLAGGGIYCTHKALQTDPRYLSLAIMPLIVAIQQFMEGLAWLGAASGNQALLYAAALSYIVVNDKCSSKAVPIKIKSNPRGIFWNRFYHL